MFIICVCRIPPIHSIQLSYDRSFFGMSIFSFYVNEAKYDQPKGAAMQLAAYFFAV